MNGARPSHRAGRCCHNCARVPHGLHSDWALLLLSEILGADKVGRLYKALDDKGLASASMLFRYG